MSSLLAFLLIAHVVLGLIALAAVHLAYMQLIRSHPPYRLIERSAWVGVFLFFASWITGAYYYVVHYGGAVKPRILAGDAPWAHSAVMEAKEHVFVIVPFLAIVFALALGLLRRAEEPRLKRAVCWLGALLLVLGTLIAASGILISGAVR